ncbi:MAG: TonB-dependent receptor [Bryobacterales bacterium]|nr:TonB-dependent receptor [Bryobacterales bacterium]
MMLRILALTLAWCAGQAFAQTTFASLTGAVTDATGAAVPGARVTATNRENNFEYRGETNATGGYSIPQLLEGEYTVRVQAQGFKEHVVNQLRLASLDVRRIDVRLEVGAVETRVEVSAGATLIETETARISDSKDAQQLKVLPMNTRSLWNFVGLTPGVTQAGAGSSTRRFAGSRANQSDASIDGITLSNQYDGTQISPLVSQIESFEEVRVDMANNTAEFGAIGQVTIVSKGGSNALHGSLFDYYSSPVMRSRNPFAAVRGTGVRHNPGFSVGGPIVIPHLYDGHNRTFFFGSYESTQGSQVLDNRNSTVPLERWRNGNFTSENIRDPFNNNAPFAGGVIPASRISPVAQKFQERFYPLPNFGNVAAFGTLNYRTQSTRPFDPNTYWTMRFDHRFSQKHFVFGRYIWNRSHSRAYDNALPAFGQRWQTRDTRGINTSYTATISATMVNEARWGYAWNDNPRHGPLMGQEVLKSLGITEGLAPGVPDIPGVLRVSFTGLAITGTSQTAWRHPGFLNFAQQFQDQLSWFRGKHNIKVGVLAGRTLYQDQNMPDALFGNLTFSNRYSNHPYADFLLGIPTSAQRGAPAIFQERTRWDWNFFVADEWKVRPNLTLNLGLRYEIHPPWGESSGLQSNFDVATGRIVIPNGTTGQISPLMPRGYVDIVEAGAAGYPDKTLLRADRNNLAPRIGLAWRPFGANTVLRAGFGIFYDVVPRQVNAGGAPFVINEPTFTNPTPTPTLLLPRIFPGAVAGPTTITLPAANKLDLRDPYSMQYNFTIEHQRWSTGFRASYIGTNTRQGQWGYNYNQPVPDATPFVDKARPFPRYPAITYMTNGAGHQYHSLTLEAERRWTNGLAYQASWVWARDIGDLERGESPENAFDRARERGVWLDIPTHRITGNLIYDLPFGKGKKFASGAGRWANMIVGGWEWSTIVSLYSGQFLTPLWTGPDPTGTAFSASRTPAQVTIRPNHLRDANIPADQRSTGRWFDASAFAAPTPGFFGTSARGVIFGPSSEIVNAGIAKNILFGERARLRLELTGTNVFNTPNYANPGTNITQLAGVGVITTTSGDVTPLDSNGPRGLRLGMRLEW